MTAGAEANLLDDVVEAIKTYVVLGDDEATACALWVAHTHVAHRLDQTMYLNISSPEPRCGKSRLMEVLALLVARPWTAILPSDAVVYRTLNTVLPPTLLMDEVDAIFAPKNADRYEGLRALINAGFRTGTPVPRCVPPSMKVQSFRVYGPKALAGIGTVPDTIADRSIPIRLKRRTRDEVVARYRRRTGEAHLMPLHDRLVEWAAAYGEAVAVAEPDLPDEMNDRAQDGCEAMIAIADLFPGWAERGRAALVALTSGERADAVGPKRLQLLAATQHAFALVPDARGMHTTVLLGYLNSTEGGWGTWYGRGLNADDLAAMLGSYEVSPRDVRVADKVLKGYRRDDLAEAWARYLPPVVAPVAPAGEHTGTGPDPAPGAVILQFQDIPLHKSEATGATPDPVCSLDGATGATRGYTPVHDADHVPAVNTTDPSRDDYVSPWAVGG